MANSYYERVNAYIPRTRAVGEQVREDYDGVEQGFNKLPPHNNNGTGFDESFVVEKPASLSSPAQLQQLIKWPAGVSANNFALSNLAAAISNDQAVRLGLMKEYVGNNAAFTQEAIVLPSEEAIALGDFTKQSYIVVSGKVGDTYSHPCDYIRAGSGEEPDPDDRRHWVQDSAGNWWIRRFNSEDIVINAENHRQTAEDVFGRQLFYGDACKVVHQYGAYYEVLAGKAYVAGIRFFYPGMQELLIEEVPNKVWVDVSWPSDPMKKRTPKVEILISPDELDDYIKENNNHYLIKIAEIDIDNVNHDTRTLSVGAKSAITHLTLEDAKNDFNLNRDFINLGERSGATYQKIFTEDEYLLYPKSGRFKDRYGNKFVLVLDGYVLLEHFGVKSLGECSEEIKFLIERGIPIKTMLDYIVVGGVTSDRNVDINIPNTNILLKEGELFVFNITSPSIKLDNVTALKGSKTYQNIPKGNLILKIESDNIFEEEYTEGEINLSTNKRLLYATEFDYNDAACTGYAYRSANIVIKKITGNKINGSVSVELTGFYKPKVIIDMVEFFGDGVRIRDSIEPHVSLSGHNIAGNTGYGCQIVGCRFAQVYNGAFTESRKAVDFSGFTTVSIDCTCDTIYAHGGGYNFNNEEFNVDVSQYGVGDHPNCLRSTYINIKGQRLSRLLSGRGRDCSFLKCIGSAMYYQFASLSGGVGHSFEKCEYYAEDGASSCIFSSLNRFDKGLNIKGCKFVGIDRLISVHQNNNKIENITLSDTYVETNLSQLTLLYSGEKLCNKSYISNISYNVSDDTDVYYTDNEANNIIHDIGSMSFFLDNNESTVYVFGLPFNKGRYFLEFYANESNFGKILLRTGSQIITLCYGSNNDIEIMNQKLTGETGIEGKITIGNYRGKIYIENRIGDNIAGFIKVTC